MAKKLSKKVAKTGKIKALKARIEDSRKGHVRLHRSFHRSYREDYQRELEVPGLLAHAMETFKIIFKNWKLFLGLILVAMVLNISLVGLMSESNYTKIQDVLDNTSAEIAGGEIGGFAKSALLLVSTITSGGLSGDSGEAAIVFVILIFLVVWLVTIFLLRHIFAGHKIKLRDGLYNATSPLLSTLVLFVVILFQCIPLFILIIVSSAAKSTGFWNTPFYALLYFIFASIMVLISGYLLSSSVIALVAATAPGLYPFKALDTASDLMAGRRIRFIIRLIYLIIVLAITWAIVALPLIFIDLKLKSAFDWLAGFPFISIVLLFMTCFSMIYATTYLYIYYRWMLNYDEN